MLKKLAIVVTLILTILSSSVASDRASYTIRCPRCKVSSLKDKYIASCNGCYCWRDLDVKLLSSDYLYYKCPHGHEIRVPYNDTSLENRLNVSEFKINNAWRKCNDE